MADFEKFNYKTLADLKARAASIGVGMEFRDDLSILGKSVKIGPATAPNAFAILPMEGCDSERDGSPSELVRRRYRRLGAGGAGLIWYEACAVVHEGRANPLQMHLTRKNLKAFASLVAETDKAAADGNGAAHRPVGILQLTHSGRYCRPDDKNAPLVPQHDPLLDPRVGLAPDAPVLSDAYLDDLIGKYVEAALLAKEAGFHGVDLKSCHRYLLSELLAGHTREGRYGGSFENRTRFLRAVLAEVRRAVGEDFVVACRLSVFDAHPYPYGWGVDKDDCWKPDLAEPLALAKLLAADGLDLLSISAGNPYFRFPQVTRPFDQGILGGETPPEHPLESVARLFSFTERVQAAMGSVPVIGSGYSWLRQFLPQAGAANVAAGRCALVGLGREAFAYPDAPRDVLAKGAMESGKCCIACSKCTQIMRDHGRTGCVIRDGGTYLPLYNEARASAAH